MSDLDATLISGERVVFATDQHWASLIASSWLPVALALASIALGWIRLDNSTDGASFLSRTVELIQLALFLGACAWVICNVITWRTAQYLVTNFRILGQSGGLRRRRTDTLLASVTDIQTATPFLGGMLGFAHIHIITTSGDAGKDKLSCIRDAEELKRHVLELKADSDDSIAFPLTPVPEPAPAVDPPLSSTVPGLQTVKLLAKLAMLRDVGAISQEEYESKKPELLRRI